ncbi:MAG TPA: response regulator [Polyangia bacterium]
MATVDPVMEGAPADAAVGTASTAPSGPDPAAPTEDPAAPCEFTAEDTAVELAPAPAPEPPPAARRAELPSTILIVDPDAVSRRFAEIAFGRRGDVRIKTALDGAAALEIISNQPVHLIISETDFTDMNGLQFLRRLVKEGRLRGVPFVFLSADARATTKSAAFAAGADDYLVKPCDGEVLATRVRGLIARERRVAAERQTPTFALTGRFSELASIDLFALLEHGRRSGTVSIACDDTTGTFYVDDGQVVHGVFGNLVGPPAYTEVMGRTEGQFEFTPGPCPIKPPRWTIAAGSSVPAPVVRSVTAKYFAPPVDAPTIVVGLPGGPAGPIGPGRGRGDGAAARLPAFVPDPGSAAQIEHAITDGFSLGDLMSFTERDLATWTAATPVRERFHVVLAAELAQGAQAMLALAGSPTEDWILRSLDARMAAVGLEFYLRRARLLDVLLIDVREPGRLVESLRRVPSVVIVAPPAGDPLALGVKARLEIVDLVSRLSPPALLVLGNPGLKKVFRALGRETAIRCLPGKLGEGGTDLRSLLAEGIRLCAGATR